MIRMIYRNHVLDKELAKKWIELKRLTGEYTFVDKIGKDTKSLYIYTNFGIRKKYI